MDYYNKYIKYKTKYLNLKYDNNQYGGGIVPCDKGYTNALETCWAVSILMILCFGHLTSNQLNEIMILFYQNVDSTIRLSLKPLHPIVENARIKGNISNFIDSKIKRNIKLFTHVFERYNIFDTQKRKYVDNILHKFCERYYAKIIEQPISTKISKYEFMSLKDNPGRCERRIAENFQNLFVDKHIIRSDFREGIESWYLFCNLLSIFFLDYKVSFKNYYDNFNKIIFDDNNDLGIVIVIDEHVCCLFICNKEEKFYNDNNKVVHNCKWKELLKTSNNNLYVVKNGSLTLIHDKPDPSQKDKLFKVEFLTVISKYTEKDTELDTDIKKFLEFKDLGEIKDYELQYQAASYYYNNRKFTEAVELYTIGAIKGYHWSQYMLGQMYLSAKGVEQNIDTAIEWLILAADNDIVDAQYLLGKIYFDNIYVNQDINTAKKWLELAANNGHADAQNLMGHIYYDKSYGIQNMDTAKKFFMLAAKNNHPDAQYMLGYMYQDGQAGVINREIAKKWFKLAADNGHNIALSELQDMEFEDSKAWDNDREIDFDTPLVL